MNGSFLVTDPGGRRGDDRLERELRSWLRGFEPGELPVVVRVRLESDLQAVAQPPSRRRWLGPAQLRIAAVVVAVLVVAVLALIPGAGSAAFPVGAGTTPDPTNVVPPGNDTGIPGPDYAAGLVLLALSALAGALVRVPAVRTVFSRVASPAAAETPDEVLPLRRSWRSVSPLVWTLGALAIVASVGSLVNLTTVMNSGSLADNIDGIASTIRSGLQVPVLVLLCVAVPLRYRMASRWTRLLMVGTSLVLGIQWLVLLVALLNPPSNYSWLTLVSLSAVGLFAIAAGLAQRASRVPRPPIALAAIGVGLLFAANFRFVAYEQFPYGLDRIDNLLGSTLLWLSSVAWLVILWVGWANRGGERDARPWRLLAIAGAFAVASQIPQLVYLILLWINSPATPDWLWHVLRWWLEYVSLGASVALTAAVLLGIRVPSNRESPAGS